MTAEGYVQDVFLTAEEAALCEGLEEECLEREQQMQVFSLSVSRTEPCSQCQCQKEQGSEPCRHWEKFNSFLKWEGNPPEGSQRAQRSLTYAVESPPWTPCWTWEQPGGSPPWS